MTTEELLRVKEEIKKYINSEEILKSTLSKSDYKLYSPANRVQELQNQLKIIEDRINTTSIEIRGGYGNKVLYSSDAGFSKGTLDDKLKQSETTIKESRERRMTEYINQKEKDIQAYVDVYGGRRESTMSKVLNGYKIKIKHKLILIIMNYINNENMLDKLSNIIYTDRKLELVKE